ncbi:DUF413 domain-containing protein [Alteromonas sp. a30]|uniref:DUF413 domain-containing protein n=1 Tax=Alteromonas sp. a30 TaxID=2730917 RepID=UPI002281299D|nr:DUF413 domain-containing protein [Alteromonas sp. a30]MCY7295363.1 DUF413 domain-containing protein [Alteromonas sp. a30]
MAKVTREQLLNSAFNDPRNYPYGFARSGDFSISESQALSQYGRLISALVSGQLSCANEEDENLLAVAQGEKSPSTVVERAWVKYQSRINRPKAGSIYGTNRNNSPASDDSDESDFIDDDVVMDED